MWKRAENSRIAATVPTATEARSRFLASMLGSSPEWEIRYLIHRSTVSCNFMHFGISESAKFNFCFNFEKRSVGQFPPSLASLSTAANDLTSLTWGVASNAETLQCWLTGSVCRMTLWSCSNQCRCASTSYRASINTSVIHFDAVSYNRIVLHSGEPYAFNIAEAPTSSLWNFLQYREISTPKFSMPFYLISLSQIFSPTKFLSI